MAVPVTEQEKKSPLYKYFEMDMVAPDPARYEEMETKPLSPQDALKAPDLNLLFDEGYLPGEFGYAQLEDGTVTLANLVPMPGVTPEMFDWWFAWHGLEPLRYKIWNKDEHYSCKTRNPEKALDASLSMKERYWDTTHDVVEAMYKEGNIQNIVINFRPPAAIGFSPEKLKNFKGTIVCSGNEHTAGIMCHFVRPTSDGSELRTRFWFGYGIRDGKPVKMLPDGVKIPVESVRELLRHNIKEFTNLAALLPKVYPEFKDKF